MGGFQGHAGGDLDFFKTSNDEVSHKKDQSEIGDKSVKGSPQKSLAIKGPPKIINDKLEIDNYQGVKVTDINVRPLN
jgi:hypothetical protein